MYSLGDITKLKPAAIAVAALLMLGSCSTINEAKVYPPIPDRLLIWGGAVAHGARAVFGR